jgi:hypothetical protein
LDEFFSEFNPKVLSTFGWRNDYPPMGVKLFDFFDMQASDHSYFVSEGLNFLKPGSAVTLHPLPTSVSRANDAVAGEALGIIVGQVPMPIHRVPWQDIAALKQESEFKYRLQLLRNWTHSIGQSSKAGSEISDDIRTQLFEYEIYMKAAGVKCEATAIDFLVTVAPGVVEDILKLRLEGLSKRLLQPRKARALLKLDELKAPGRAISIVPYIAEHLH